MTLCPTPVRQSVRVSPISDWLVYSQTSIMPLQYAHSPSLGLYPLHSPHYLVVTPTPQGSQQSGTAKIVGWRVTELLGKNACHLSPVTCSLSPVTCNLSHAPVSYHLSPVTCHPPWYLSESLEEREVTLVEDCSHAGNLCR